MNTHDVLAFLDDLSEEEFVLHGSSQKHEFLLPQDPDQGHLIPEYNQVAVYGTCSVEVALLYATVRASTTDWGWRFMTDKFRPYFLVVGPERLAISAGYVHIIKRYAFQEFVLDGLACLASRPVKTEQVLTITADILEVLIDQKRIHVLSYEEYQDQYQN